MKMAINPLIEHQALEAFVMFFAGMAVMILHQIFSWLKRKANTGKYMSFVLDLIFWLTAAVLTTLFLNYACFGKLSFHSGAAFVIGLVLWKKIFCGII